MTDRHRPVPDQPMDRRIMVFEVTRTGHRLEYIRHLLCALAETTVPGSFVFMLGSDFQGHIDAGCLSEAEQRNDVSVSYMSVSETARCTSGSVLRRALHTYRVFESHLAETQSDLGFVMYIDTITPALGLRLSRNTRKPISGILFRPTVHYADLGEARVTGARGQARARQRMKALRDGVLVQLSLLNPRTEHLLSLDPYFLDYARSHYRGAHKLSRLPEPSPVALGTAGDRTEDVRLTFLLFGLISARKGAMETLDALELLSPDEAARTRLVLAGAISQNHRTALLQRVAEVKRVHGNMEIVIRDEFVPDRELADTVARADVVLAPYRRHVGSSGVLTWAAHHGKPVIAQAYGLVGELVERWGLGLTCDPADPVQFSECLRVALSEGPDAVGSQGSLAEYARVNTTSQFVGALLRGMGATPQQ